MRKKAPSLQKFRFPKSFSLRGNEKHFSNAAESLKLNGVFLPK